jgi:hypothetical protein
LIPHDTWGKWAPQVREIPVPSGFPSISMSKYTLLVTVGSYHKVRNPHQSFFGRDSKPWTGVKLQTRKPYSKLRIQADTNLGCGGNDGQSDNGGDEDSAHGNVVQFE